MSGSTLVPDAPTPPTFRERLARNLEEQKPVLDLMQANDTPTPPTTRRQQTRLVGDDQRVVRAAEVARLLNQPEATMRTVGADLGVTAGAVHRLLREAGYRQMWVTVEGACTECGAPNGGGYITPGCSACSPRWAS